MHRRLVLLALLGGLLAAILLLRGPLGRWLYPDAALDGLLAAADAAMAEGDVLRAATLLQAAAARSPDHPRLPVERAEAVGIALARVDTLLGGPPGPPLAVATRAEVEALLAAAAALGAPGETLEPRRRRLAERAEPSIEVLLQRALAAEQADPEAALADYLRVLAREPGNTLARHGRQQVLSAWLGLAVAEIERGEWESARLRLRRVRALDPGHVDLPAVEARLAGRHGSAAGPPPDPALQAGRSREALRWLGLAEEALGRGALDTARRALDQAALLAPEAPEREALEQRYRHALSAAR